MCFACVCVCVCVWYECVFMCGIFLGVGHNVTMDPVMFLNIGSGGGPAILMRLSHF